MQRIAPVRQAGSPLPAGVLIVLVVFLLTALWAEPARAGLFGQKPAQPGLSLAVFESGRIMVRDVRPLDLPLGPGRTEISGVLPSLEPGSLQVRSLSAPDGLAVLAVDLRPGLSDAGVILRSMEGREVSVILPLGDGALSESRKAVLVSAGNPPVLRLDSGLYVGPVHSYLLDQPVNQEPRLILETDNQGPEAQILELSYLASGISWSADYRLDLDNGGDAGLLTAWATVDNGLALGLDQIWLSLVSGDLNQVAAEPLMAMDEGLSLRMETTMKAAPMPQAASVFAYHVYDLDRPVDLAPGAGVQLALFPAAKVDVARQLVSTFDDFYLTRTPEPLEQAVEVRLTLANDEGHGPGRALPAGVVRVFQERPDGSTLLVGEERMGRQALGRDIVLAPGRSFDVTVERLLEDYEKRGERGAILTWAITVKNGGERGEDLLLEDNLPGEWKVRQADTEYERKSATTLAFSLELEPGAEQVVRYTVEIQY